MPLQSIQNNYVVEANHPGYQAGAPQKQASSSTTQRPMSNTAASTFNAGNGNGAVFTSSQTNSQSNSYS